MKTLKRTLAVLLALTMIFAIVATTAVSVSANDYKIQRQLETKWKSYYYGGGDYNEYATIIANGAEYLERECYRTFTVNPTCYAGLIEYVVIPKSDTAEYTVTVNGIEIPLSYEEDNCLYYGFIMPCCDVEIAITEVVEQDIH